MIAGAFADGEAEVVADDDVVETLLLDVVDDELGDGDSVLVVAGVAVPLPLEQAPTPRASASATPAASRRERAFVKVSPVVQG
jgi:hypothetical protein